jgi:hypothetical protein
MIMTNGVANADSEPWTPISVNGRPRLEGVCMARLFYNTYTQSYSLASEPAEVSGDISNKKQNSSPKFKSSDASLTAYAAAWVLCYYVRSSLAGIDEALKRYALSVDEWRETMQLLNVCLFFFFFFFRVLYSGSRRPTRRKAEAGNI